MKLIGSESLYPAQTHLYRGVKMRFEYDQARREWWADLFGERTWFGQANSLFLQDAQLLVDWKLDTIAEFPDFPASRLFWAKNGGSRDIKLSWRRRLLKVWLVADPNRIDLHAVAREARSILERVSRAS